MYVYIIFNCEYQFVYIYNFKKFEISLKNLIHLNKIENHLTLYIIR